MITACFHIYYMNCCVKHERGGKRKIKKERKFAIDCETRAGSRRGHPGQADNLVPLQTVIL
jgi:hypothetical protein